MLDFETVDAMDKDTAKKTLDELLKNKELEMSLLENPHLLKFADQRANELIWLEERIKNIEYSENMTKANNARWGRE